jgi:hypothetical protein
MSECDSFSHARGPNDHNIRSASDRFCDSKGWRAIDCGQFGPGRHIRKRLRNDIFLNPNDARLDPRGGCDQTWFLQDFVQRKQGGG